MANETVAQERLEGALACVSALANLTNSAEHPPKECGEDAEAFLRLQLSDAAFLAASFGPMTPRQEGAIRALGEYIHASITTGQPNLDRWKPYVAYTEAERTAWVESVKLD